MNNKLNKGTSARPNKERNSSRDSGGGAPSIRGFLLQALVCLLDALNQEQQWKEVKFEPEWIDDRSGTGDLVGNKSPKKLEKIDVIWRLDSGHRAQQIRSRTKSIPPGDISRWAGEMKAAYPGATELELILVGSSTYEFAANPICDGVKITQSPIIGLGAFQEICAFRIGRLLEEGHHGHLSSLAKMNLVDHLTVQLFLNSQAQSYISRAELHTRLQQLIREFRASWPSDLSREKRERAEFKSVFRFETGPSLRTAVTAAYFWLEDSVSPDLFGFASRSLKQVGGRLRVSIGREVKFDCYLAWVLFVLNALMFLLLPIMFILTRMEMLQKAALPKNIGNAEAFSILFNSSGIVEGSVLACFAAFALVTYFLTLLWRPFYTARRIQKELNRIGR